MMRATVPGVDVLEERSARPLIVSADESLLDDLLRLAAAAGTVPEVASDIAAARRAWAAAGAVVVGPDLATAMSELRLPRRPGVVLVAGHAPDSSTWAHAVALGAAEVHTLPQAQAAVIDLFGDCIEGSGAGAAAVSVIGSCGGSGATAFAAALAMTSAGATRPTLVVDADPIGGGIDLVLGAEHVPGVRWPELAGTSGRLSAPSLRAALPRMGELSMLSHDRGEVVPVPAAAMRSVLAAGRRGHELVVVDLPRRLDPAAEEAVVRSDVTLVVVPAEVRAVAAASRVLTSVRELATNLGLVVRGPGPSGLQAQQIEESLGVPVWALMRADKGLGPALDEGLGPLRRQRGPLAACCKAVLGQLAGQAVLA
jgi:secretion/DNA translocation related CpaE-like protein